MSRLRSVFNGTLLLGVLAAASATAAPKGKSVVHTVVIDAIKYQPVDVELAAGDTVEWKNEDLVPHTATAADGAFDSGSIQPGKKWHYRVPKAGKILYGCRFHPGMKGKLVAQ